jgi:PilZ domain
MLEGRKHLRTPERFLVQISALHDPLQAEVTSVENISFHGVRVTTERPWEPGAHVAIKSATGELMGRARVVYCQAIGPRAFAVGLDLLTRTNAWDARSGPLTVKQRK